MFAVKTGAYWSETLFRCSTLGKAPGLSHIHLTKLERLDRDKHSGVFLKVVTYGRKKFYNIGTRANVTKTAVVIHYPLFSLIAMSGNPC
jgi:hypothetical protein